MLRRKRQRRRWEQQQHRHQVQWATSSRFSRRPSPAKTSSIGSSRSISGNWRNRKQSLGGKWPGGPEEHLEDIEWLREARGGATASSSCVEAAARVGGYGGNSVDPRLRRWVAKVGSADGRRGRRRKEGVRFVCIRFKSNRFFCNKTKTKN